MNNPEYIKIGKNKYKINTDYRVALKCQDIASDKTLSNYEKTIGVVYTLFQIDNDIDNKELEMCLKSAFKYLQGRPGKNAINGEKSKRDMDYKQDWGLIFSSMWQQYNIDLNKEKMHWWTFYDLLNGLSSECVFNQVRQIRNKDLSEIKSEKTRNEYIKLKQIYRLDEPEYEPTEKEKQGVEMFYKLTGIERK